MPLRKPSPYDHHRGAAPLLRRTSWWRTWVFLALNLLGFAAANAFWQYLATGRWTNFTAKAYLDDLIVPLGEMFIHPLSVIEHPWMILVFGMVLAVVMFVPIVVSVLYRMAVAVVFVLIVAVVGHAPVLALTLALGCILASRTPLRSDLPFLAVLLGIVPAAVYLYMFAYAGVGSSAVLPMQRWVLIAPFMVAVVGAVVAAVIVLLLAEATKFKPGVVWPVLGVLAALPAGIFYWQVGPGEIEYAMITRGLAPGDAVFASRSLASWRRDKSAEGFDQRTLAVRIRNDLQLEKALLIGRCERFVREHGEHPRAGDVLWVRAQCESLQPSLPALEAGWVAATAEHTSPKALDPLNELIDKHPASPQAVLARWRLGVLAIRGGRISQADAYLRLAREQLHRIVRVFAGPDDGDVGVFSRPASIPSAPYYTRAMIDVRRILWIMEQNDVLDDTDSAKALADYFNVNRHGLTEREYLDKLVELTSKHKHTKMGGNLRVAAALAISDRDERARRMVELAEDHDDIDSEIEVNFELAQLAQRSKRLSPSIDLKSAETYFRIVKAAPPNPWTDVAADRLRWHRARSAESPQP